MCDAGQKMWLAKNPSPWNAASSAISGVRIEPCQTNGGTPSSGRGARVKPCSGVRNFPSQSTTSSRHSRRSRPYFSTVSGTASRMSSPNHG